MKTKGLSFLLIFGTRFRFSLIAKKPIFRIQVGWVILVIELANTEARMINMNYLLNKMEEVLNVPDIDLQKTAQESLPKNWKIYKMFDIPMDENFEPKIYQS
jgi:hypothetical protein